MGSRKIISSDVISSDYEQVLRKYMEEFQGHVRTKGRSKADFLSAILMLVIITRCLYLR